jgi:hypothetical protein
MKKRVKYLSEYPVEFYRRNSNSRGKTCVYCSIHPIDHPGNVLGSLYNGTANDTTAVLGVDMFSGEVETMNTIYYPDHRSKFKFELPDNCRKIIKEEKPEEVFGDL